MLSSTDVVRQSLELHLFFLRLMKEHMLFLQLALMPKDKSLIKEVVALQFDLDKLLGETIALSRGVISSEVLKSGEIITLFTLPAEVNFQYFTGIHMNTNLTQATQGLKSGMTNNYSPKLDQQVGRLNNNVTYLLRKLIVFKTKALSDVLSCHIFMNVYPSLIKHTVGEAKFYLKQIQKLQKCESIYLTKTDLTQEGFWNHIMEDHIDFVRGLLDPSERQLIAGAQSFKKDLERLTSQLNKATEKDLPITLIMRDIVKVIEEIQDFNEQAIQGILECKIKSMILALLGDHILRETNHYLRLLKSFY